MDSEEHPSPHLSLVKRLLSLIGLAIHQLGHNPRSGETIDICGLTIQVPSATKRRISSLKISRSVPTVSQ